MKPGILIASSMLLFASCMKSGGNNPGVEYAPDMADSKGYEPYNQKDSAPYNKYGMNMREPVAGTVALGKLDYAYAYDNTAEGYEAAGLNLTYPAGFSDKHAEGQRLYGIYCTPCHGAKGENDGSVFKVANIKPPWASYKDTFIRTLPVGKIYHVLTYGKNNMGSHASVLSPTERWQITRFVKLLSQGIYSDKGTGDVVTPAANAVAPKADSSKTQLPSTH